MSVLEELALEGGEFVGESDEERAREAA
jgi:hypothetical protein